MSAGTCITVERNPASERDMESLLMSRGRSGARKLE